jgi:FkbM family methyltransferase
MNPWKGAMDSLGHSTLRARLTTGDPIFVFADDFIGRMVYFFGDLDPTITSVCRLLLSPGDTVLDVRANVGVVSLLSARLVGQGGRVHAFEPQPEISALLANSSRENSFDWMDVHACAVSREDGTLTLSIPDKNFGEASLMRSPEGSTHHETPVISLDSFATNRKLDHIRLLKVDVEGHEESVFSGAERLLQENPPDFVLFESNSERTIPVLNRGSVKILRSHQYDIYDLARGWFGVRLIPCDESGNAYPKSDDLLAVRSSAKLPKALGVRR